MEGPPASPKKGSWFSGRTGQPTRKLGGSTLRLGRRAGSKQEEERPGAGLSPGAAASISRQITTREGLGQYLGGAGEETDAKDRKTERKEKRKSLSRRDDSCGVLEVTVLEGRALPVATVGKAVRVRVHLEGLADDTMPLSGPDPHWEIPSDDPDNPHPLGNFFSLPVVDVAQANLHVMLLDSDDTLLASGLVSLSCLVRFGRSIHEVTRWLVLQPPSNVYFPSAEDLVAMGHHLHPASKKKKQGTDDSGHGHAHHDHEPHELPPLPSILGYLQVRLHLRLKQPSAFQSLIYGPSIVDLIPPEVEKVLVGEEAEEPVFHLVARARLLFAFVFAFTHSWSGMMMASIPLWYHLVFFAPLWEYPLLIIVVPSLAITIRNVIRLFSKPKAVELADAGLISSKSRVKSSELGNLTEPMKQLFNALVSVLGTILPPAEKVQNAFNFVVPDISLIFVAGMLFLGVLMSLLVLLFDDATVVFFLGLVALIPATIRVLTTALWGKEVHIYSLEMVKGRDLKPMDPSGTSDPYVRIPGMTCLKSGKKVKTAVVKKTLSPEWNEKFRVSLPLAFHRGLESFELEVWDQDVGAKDDFMGTVYLRAQDFRFDQRRWFPCIDEHGKKYGEVQIGLKYIGATYASFQTSANPYWRRWPMVQRLSGWLPSIPLANVAEKLPNYEEGARVIYSNVCFFQNVHNVVPKKSK